MVGAAIRYFGMADEPRRVLRYQRRGQAASRTPYLLLLAIIVALFAVPAVLILGLAGFAWLTD